MVCSFYSQRTVVLRRDFAHIHFVTPLGRQLRVPFSWFTHTLPWAHTLAVKPAIASARDKFKNSLHYGAKVVAALKRLYIASLNGKQIPQDVPFSSKKAGKGGCFEQNCGGLLPGRVEALAALFNSLVLTLDLNGKPLLTEKNFDAAKVDWLEKANAIVSLA